MSVPQCPISTVPQQVRPDVCFQDLGSGPAHDEPGRGDHHQRPHQEKQPKHHRPRRHLARAGQGEATETESSLNHCAVAVQWQCTVALFRKSHFSQI